MYLLIIFFISLIGITTLIGRKLILLRKGQVNEEGEMLFEMPSLSEVKSITVESAKKGGDALLVMIVKGYFKVLNYLKHLYREIKENIKKAVHSYFNPHGTPEGEQEASKFLKMVSSYKSKIRKIKRKVSQEDEKRKI